MNTIRNTLTALILAIISVPIYGAEMVRQIETIGGYDGYVSSIYTPYFQDTASVRIGGWGDTYVGLIRFNPASLPTSVQSVSLSYYVTNNGGGSTTVPMTMYALSTPFGQNQYWLNNLLVYSDSIRSVSQPQSGNWMVIDITDYYRKWKAGTYRNHGIVLLPTATNNRFNNLQAANPVTPSSQKPFIRVSYASSPPTASFMTFPLNCTSPSCALRYLQGAYTSGMVTSVLDHSMVINPNGKYPYKQPGSTNGSNGAIVGFNGEVANGPVLSSDSVCVGGSILLKPTPSSPPSTALTNIGGCGAGYQSYDEHPGYDYRATIGSTVKAVAGGVVVSTGCVLIGINNCSDWGYVGIDHENGYISQYGHLSRTDVIPGTRVIQGQQIGLSGDKGVPNAPHLHFEVLKLIPGRANNYSDANYAIVDPYGWVGTGSDPLYSRAVWNIAPVKLWQ